MRKMLSVLLAAAAVAAVGALAACFVIAAYGSASAISVIISVPNSTFHIGQPITTQVELTNLSGTEINVARSLAETEAQVTCSVLMLDSTGHPIQRTSYGDAAEKHQLVSSLRVVSLRPAETLKQTMELTKLFEITKPDTYTVRVGRKWPEGNGNLVWSNSLTLTITK